MVADAELWGIDAADLSETFEEDGVWSDNVEATYAFLSIQTQWRWQPAGMERGTIAGLDYAGARAGLKAAGFDITPELWGDIMLIEAGALQAKNKDN